MGALLPQQSPKVGTISIERKPKKKEISASVLRYYKKSSKFSNQQFSGFLTIKSFYLFYKNIQSILNAL